MQSPSQRPQDPSVRAYVPIQHFPAPPPPPPGRAADPGAEDKPQSTLRRIRRQAPLRFIEAAKQHALRILQGNRTDLWKFPGLYVRPATPDLQAALLEREGYSFHISRGWSRCALFFFVLFDQPVAVLLQKENHRLEVVNPDPRLPFDLFRGTVLDGYLDLAGGAAAFRALDVVCWKGRWVRRAPFPERFNPMEEVTGLTAGPAPEPAHTLQMAPLKAIEGVQLPSEADRFALVLSCDGRQYRAYQVLAWAPGAAAPDAHEEEEEEDLGYFPA
jgi:hypothetical protein